MAGLSSEEIERIREEERVRAQVRAEVAAEQATRLRRGTFAKTLVLWALLIVVMFGIWRVFATSPEQTTNTQQESR